MKPTLYLHIGAAKSGSSAIQAALRANRAALRERGYLVPALDLAPHGYVSSGGHVVFFDKLRPIDDGAIRTTTERLRRLRSYLDANHLKAAVISAENLVGGDFARLFQPAQEFFTIEVIVYIRRQDEYAVAVWNQWHFKSSPDFREWTNTLPRGFGNWNAIIARWPEALPSSTLRVRLFDQARLVNGDVVHDFMSLLSIGPEELSLADVPVNRSLGDLAMRVAQRNRHLFTDHEDHRFLEFLRSVGGERIFRSYGLGLYFGPDERRAFLARFTASNERLRQKHFPEMAPGSLFAYEPETKDLVVSDVEAVEHELQLVWSALFRSWGRSGTWATRQRIQDLAWGALFAIWGAPWVRWQGRWSAAVRRLREPRSTRQR